MFEEFNRDTAFLDNISLWGVVKGVLTVVLIYGLVFTIGKAKFANQEEQRIEEVGMAVTALVSEGYSIYIDGQREVFIPDIGSYNIEFDRDARAIYLTHRQFSEKAMLLSFFGLGEGGRSLLPF